MLISNTKSGDIVYIWRYNYSRALKEWEVKKYSNEKGIIKRKCIVISPSLKAEEKDLDHYSALIGFRKDMMLYEHCNDKYEPGGGDDGWNIIDYGKANNLATKLNMNIITGYFIYSDDYCEPAITYPDQKCLLCKTDCEHSYSNRDKNYVCKFCEFMEKV